MSNSKTQDIRSIVQENPFSNFEEKPNQLREKNNSQCGTINFSAERKVSREVLERFLSISFPYIVKRHVFAVGLLG